MGDGGIGHLAAVRAMENIEPNLGTYNDMGKVLCERFGVEGMRAYCDHILAERPYEPWNCGWEDYQYQVWCGWFELPRMKDEVDWPFLRGLFTHPSWVVRMTVINGFNDRENRLLSLWMEVIAPHMEEYLDLMFRLAEEGNPIEKD